MLKNMKIRTRMMLSYAIILVLTVVAGITAVIMLQSVGSNLTGFYNKQFQTTNYQWAARRAVYASQSDLALALLEENSADKAKYLDNMKTEIQTLTNSLNSLKNVFEGDMTLVTAIEGDLQKANDLRAQIVSLVEADNDTQAFQMLKNQYIPITDQIRQNFITIGQQADANAQNRVAQGNTSTVIAIAVVAALAAMSVLVGIAFAIVISNGIRKPVSEIEQAARDLSAGKLNTNIQYQSRDELGDLAESMRKTTQGLSAIISDLSYLMSEMASGNFDIATKNEAGYVGDFRPVLLSIRDMNVRLSDTLHQINQAADQVSSGSDQVSSGAQALSQGATEQASSVEELAASINEISQQVQQNAASAQQASERADAMGKEMQESNQQMQQMTEAMTEISQSSREIGKIIKTIEDIAFQTNILALNAAVEAARAGAAGKGFAVVADEVRNLASKSADASKNTASLIENSIRSVENGTQIVDATAQSLLRAVEGATEVSSTVDIISKASNDQAQSIMQVTQGIDQISSVVQTNSATAEESAAASEELSGQAQMLKNLVSRFHLRANDAAVHYDYIPDSPSSKSASSQLAANTDKY